MPSRRDSSRPDSCNKPRCVEMRDWPSWVISCNSLTDSSLRSNNAMIRSRVGSDNARKDFKMADMQIKVDSLANLYIFLSRYVNMFIFESLSA